MMDISSIEDVFSGKWEGSASSRGWLINMKYVHSCIQAKQNENVIEIQSAGNKQMSA